MRRLGSLAAIGLLVAVALLPGQTNAAFNDVQLTADTDLVITDSGVVIVAKSGGKVASLTLNSGNIEVGLSSGSSITLQSNDKRILTATPAVATYVCGSANSYITLESSTTQTVTVSIGAVCSASSSSSSSTTTGGGGGGQSYGGGLSSPSGGSVVINGNAATANQRRVTLTLTAQNSSEMLVANTTAFTDLASWVPFSGSLPWTLSAGVGEKTVYVKFRSSSGGVSPVVSDTITLTTDAPLPAASPTLTPTLAPSPVPLPAAAREADLVKEPGKRAVYLIENGKRRVFPRADIFLAHGYQWPAVRELPSLASVPLGDPVDYPAVAGMLVKGSDAKVWLIQDGKRRWITSESVFLGLGYRWSAIRVMFDATISAIPAGDDVSQAQAHVDGTLIKYAGSPKVYVLENGKKRWISTAEAFRQRGFRWENILTIPKTFVYPDGPTLDATPTPTGKVLGVAFEPVFTADLAPGDSGEAVRTLQQVMIVRGYFPNDVAPNGNYGPTTVAAVKRLQDAFGLPKTGIFASKTRAALNQLLGQ